MTILEIYSSSYTINRDNRYNLPTMKIFYTQIHQKASEKFKNLGGLRFLRCDYFLCFNAAWAAARRAMGTRKGEQLT